MTRASPDGIVEELGLGAVGLEYREMDPFSIAVHRDGAIVRFHRSVERTVAGLSLHHRGVSHPHPPGHG